MTLDVAVLRRGDSAYPPLLAELVDPPDRLYCLGAVELLSRTAVAVVGSRRATLLGIRMAEWLGADLAAAGVVVVSGCAVGIDAAAHRGALGVGGATVGVLGGGLDVAVPRANAELAERIARDGCLISEHPLGEHPTKRSFPRRNRILAGLSRIAVVVEAAKGSGAGITARLAGDSGREVMAVPGHPLSDNSAGVSKLLRDGAGLVEKPDDVLNELAKLPGLDWGPPVGARKKSPVATMDARPDSLAGRILSALGPTPRAVDDLARDTGIDVPPLLAALTELEILGLARAGAGRYARTRPGQA